MPQQVSASLSKAQLQLHGHALTIAHLFGMRVVWLLKISFVPVQASTNERTCIVGCHCQYMHGRTATHMQLQGCLLDLNKGIIFNFICAKGMTSLPDRTGCEFDYP